MKTEYTIKIDTKQKTTKDKLFWGKFRLKVLEIIKILKELNVIRC